MTKRTPFCVTLRSVDIGKVVLEVDPLLMASGFILCKGSPFISSEMVATGGFSRELTISIAILTRMKVNPTRHFIATSFEKLAFPSLFLLLFCPVDYTVPISIENRR